MGVRIAEGISIRDYVKAATKFVIKGGGGGGICPYHQRFEKLPLVWYLFF